jgi:glutamyl-tRNA reductase
VSDTSAALDRVHVRFATVRDHSADERSALASRLQALPADERVLLETCHRVELVSIDDEPAAGTAVVGSDAVRRVFHVVAGFDSAVVAEEQLLGQARTAYQAALAGGSTGPILNELFRRAIHFGRRVRSHARPGSDRSLADRAVGWLLERLPDGPAHVLVAGTGEMGRLAANALAAAGHRLTVASGSADRGRRVADGLPGFGHLVALRPLAADAVAGLDGMVLAQRSAEPTIGAALLGDGRPWTVDLSSPAAVAPEAATLLGERLLTIDGLAGLDSPSPVLEPAIERRLRREMDEEVDRFVAWLEARRGADAIAALHGRADAIRRRHVERLRRRGRLDAEQLDAVEATAAAIVGELLHGPSVELRRDGADAATIRRIFGIES